MRVLPTRVRPARGGGGLAYACVCTGKIRKLRESVAGKKLEAQAADEGSCTIFLGVCVWVDGFTSPSHAEIQTLMVLRARPPPPPHRLHWKMPARSTPPRLTSSASQARHGGRFEHYFDGSVVTHVIAEDLAHAILVRYLPAATLRNSVATI